MTRDPLFELGVDSMRDAVANAEDWYEPGSPEWYLLMTVGAAIRVYDAEQARRDEAEAK